MIEQLPPGHGLQHDVVVVTIVVEALIDTDDIGVLNNAQDAHLVSIQPGGKGQNGGGVAIVDNSKKNGKLCHPTLVDFMHLASNLSCIQVIRKN